MKFYCVYRYNKEYCKTDWDSRQVFSSLENASKAAAELLEEEDDEEIDYIIEEEEEGL